jgi:hypothetical protein
MLAAMKLRAAVHPTLLASRRRRRRRGAPCGVTEPVCGAAAIRLKQLAQAQGRETSVCVVEKGAEVGTMNCAPSASRPIGCRPRRRGAGCGGVRWRH